jgi:Dynamin family
VNEDVDLPRGGLSWADLLAECEILAAAGRPQLAQLATAARNARLGLGQPLRLAVAGQIKRGKSTLVNALLGQDVAATGQLELTFTVTEFRHAERVTVTVRYKDGSEEDFPAGRLRELTVRDAENAHRIGRIHRVEYGFPNELLRSFRLVDTPGLGSIHGLDSANTMQTLGIAGFASATELAEINAMLGAMGRTAEQIHRDSAAELDRADAVLYLYSRAQHVRDLAAVESFAGASTASMTPLKAFGVLTRCDEFWPPQPGVPGWGDPMGYDPVAVGARLAAADLEQPEARRLFCTIVPVAGKVGIGAQSLTSEEFGWLADLSKGDLRVVADRLDDTATFANRASLHGIMLPADQRAALVQRLGTWGIMRACCYLNAGLGPGEVRARLLSDSGLTRLRDLIIGHFGNRSALIKLDHGLGVIAAEIATCRREDPHTQDARLGRLVDGVADRIEYQRGLEHEFAELAVLTDHYNRRLSFTPDEVADMLSVTGEFGTSVAARLGSPGGDLSAAAKDRIDAWARREQDPMLDPATAKAARILRHSYERVAQRIRLAENQ